MVRAATPTPGTAPLTGRCTRSERVHCLRIGCTAYGSGAPPTLTSTTVANAPPPPTHSPIPHVIPWRPNLAAPRKPQNSNVPTSTVETLAGELRAKCGGCTPPGTQRQKRHTQHTGTQQTPTATRLRGLSFSSLPRAFQARFHSETPRMPRCIETRRQQQTPARRLRSSAGLEVVLRGQQDLLPHADRVVVRLAGLGLVVGDRR